MSSINGRMLTCDRCGKSIFLKCTGEGVADGGYTRWNTFENPPEDWNCVKDVGSVCPECWEDFQIMMERYKKKPPVVKEGNNG